MYNRVAGYLKQIAANVEYNVREAEIERLRLSPAAAYGMRKFGALSTGTSGLEKRL